MTANTKPQTPLIPRLKAKYQAELAPELKTELGLTNLHQVPKLDKVVVSCGVGRNRDDKRYVEFVISTLTKITGQVPAPRHAKKSIATFKIRKGMGAPIGYLVTLRGAKMYEFVDRLINVTLPRVRDFHGVSRKGFDRQGNYNLGLAEQSVFPEISFEDAAVSHGVAVTFVIKNGSKEGSLKLLEKLGMPFEKKEAK